MLHILLYAYFQLYILNIYFYTRVHHLSNKMFLWVDQSRFLHYVLKAMKSNSCRPAFDVSNACSMLMSLPIRIKSCLPASVFTRESPLSPQRLTFQ